MKKPTKATESKQSAVAAPADPKTHTTLFAQAMKVFTAGNYAQARDLFDKAARGPVLSVNESALMYSRMCSKRLEKPAVDLKTPEDLYTYAISLINAERFRDAVPHLEKAIASSAQSHYLYALAICLGRTGSVEAAVDHLRRAVNQDGSIRNVARSDSDFIPLLEHSAVRELVNASGGSSV